MAVPLAATSHAYLASTVDLNDLVVRREQVALLCADVAAGERESQKGYELHERTESLETEKWILCLQSFCL